MKKKSIKPKSLVNSSLPTVTPTTRRSGMANINPNIGIPQAPINQIAPVINNDGARRRRMSREMQSLMSRKGK